ncbi:MAG: OsmC family protein [Candidatus Thorarchaeota archaeon]|nr:OsmC family protein [Candidatus Thorarchaeota archaeon]
MSVEHSYKMNTESIGKKVVTMRLEGMDEVKVTSAPDWWSEAEGGMFSPQTLFVSASASCLILSLYQVAERMHYDFKHAFVDAYGEMEEVDGVWKFAKIELNLKVTIDDESMREKIAKAAEMAHNFCPIRNSLSIPSILNYEVIVE